MQKLRTYPNFKRKNKWLGIIDYKSLIILIIYILVIYKLTGILKLSIFQSVYTIIICVFPVLGIFYANSREDNVSETLIIIAMYIISPKRYCYLIEDNIVWEEYIRGSLHNERRKNLKKSMIGIWNKYSCKK